MNLRIALAGEEPAYADLGRGGLMTGDCWYQHSSIRLMNLRMAAWRDDTPNVVRDNDPRYGLKTGKPGQDWPMLNVRSCGVPGQRAVASTPCMITVRTIVDLLAYHV